MFKSKNLIFICLPKNKLRTKVRTNIYETSKTNKNKTQLVIWLISVVHHNMSILVEVLK